MRIEHHDIFRDFQKQVFISTAISVGKNPFLEHVKLSFHALKAALSLQFLSTPSITKAEEKHQRNEDIKKLFLAIFSPQKVLPAPHTEDYSLLKIESKVDKWLDQQLDNEEYLDFRPLKSILDGSDTKTVEAAINQFMDEMRPLDGRFLNKEQVRDIIYRQAEKVAEETYLIDKEKLIKLRGKRQTGKINETYQHKAISKRIEKEIKSIPLSPEEIKQLKLLSKCIKYASLDKQDKLSKISDQEKDALEVFLFNALNNQALNQKLNKMSEKQIPLGISTDAVEFLKKMTYKGQYHHQFIKIIPKVERLVGKLDNPDQIQNNEKLSLSEFGILKLIADLSKNFKILEKAGLIREGHYLKVLEDKSITAKELMKKIDGKVQSEINEKNIYRSGDISAFQSLKWEKFLVKKPTREVDLMRRWITHVGHGALIYRTKPNKKGFSKAMQSHIYRTYENESLGAHQIAFSEIWRMDLSKLTDPKSPLFQLLNQIYKAKGQDVYKEIQKIYEEATRNIHEDLQSNFEDMENQEVRRFAAGWADFGLKGGHKRKIPRRDSFFKVYEQFVKGPKKKGTKKRVICSEFVSKAVIASLMETDKRLVRVIEEYVKRHSDDPTISKMAQGLFNVNKEGLHLLNLPYEKDERLKRIHPGRMLDLLQKKNCITKVDPPSIIKAIFTE